LERADIGAMVILLLMVVGIGVRSVSFAPMSGVDEIQHYDVIRQYGELRTPGYGATMLPESILVATCRGIDSADLSPVDPPLFFGVCDPLVPLEQVPEFGKSYEAGQPPLYYAVGAVFDQILRQIGIHGDNVVALRLFNVLWAAVAFAAVWLVLRARVPSAVGLLAMAGFFLNPATFETFSAISNDPAVVTVGALLLAWTVTFSSNGSRHLGLGLAVGVVAALTKSTAVLPVMVACATAMVWAGPPSSSELRRRTLPALAPGIGWAAATLGWSLWVIRNSTELPPDTPPFSRMVDDFWATLVGNLTPQISLRLEYAPLINFDSLAVYRLLAFAVPIVTIAVGAALLRWRSVWSLFRRSDRDGRWNPFELSIVFPFVVAVVTFTSGPIIAVLSEVGSGVAHAMKPRFALGLMPMLLVAFALMSTPVERLKVTASGRVCGPAFPLLLTLLLVNLVGVFAYLFTYR
jgi:hypothetical protein